MLEAGVQVSFFAETYNLVEMGIVNVSVNSEQSLENILHNISEVLWEGNI